MAIETIVAAIAGAVSAGATETGKKVVGDAYEGLKALIKRRFREGSEAATAIEKLEAKPESAGRKASLGEELEAVGAGADKELVATAEAVLAKIRELPQGTSIRQTATGDGNIQIVGHGVSVNVGSSGRRDDGG